MNEMFRTDLTRVYGSGGPSVLQRVKMPPELKYLRAFRSAAAAKGRFRRIFGKLLLRRMSRITGIQISRETQIGKGFYIGHFGRLIVNPEAVIGDNVNIATGVTIGQESRGVRKGCPTIGNNVWIGTNAVIVGKITVGDDVLIAPLSFVNFDVPAHSIVIGNPAKIISREGATEGYILNKV
ncbi:MAG: serine O-acetyltransferase [Acutalibacteraceae bacterium]